MNKKYFLLLFLLAIPACGRFRQQPAVPVQPATVEQPPYEGPEVEAQQVPAKEEMAFDEEPMTYTEEDEEEMMEEVAEPEEVAMPMAETERGQGEVAPEGEAEEDIDLEDLDLEEEDDALPEVSEGEEKLAYYDRGSELKPIYYDFNSKMIRPDQEPVLVKDIETAKKLAENGYTLIVEGHACNSPGSKEECNMRISQERAEEVAKYLAERGIPKDCITAVGRGANLPLVESGNRKEQAPNRRVEILALRDDMPNN